MRRARVAIVVIVAAFAILAALRLNGFSLLEPDSPDYLFGAKSLASFDGYRELDRPGKPLQTFRPPGLPLLLVPLAWAAPYSVVGAKLVVVAAALLALWLAARLAARDGPSWGAPAAVALIASSPYALLHATEVVSEFPYLAASLAAILLVTRHTGRPSRREVAALAALLTLLPFLRTIGVAMVLAVALWAVCDRARHRWLPAPLVAAAGTALWMARNQLAGGPSYFGAIAAAIKGSGTVGFAWRACESAGFYAVRFWDVSLPGLWPGSPLYERMTIGGTADLGGLYGLSWVAALAVILLVTLGAGARWRRDGALIAIYALPFLAVLAVYPPRHERLIWPLVPMAWALVPAGGAVLARRLAGRPAVVRALATLGAAAAAGLVIWQAAASLRIAGDNLAWARGGERFYSERIPPLYFADWRAAGSWLRENAPAGSVVLTRHSDVGLTSGLPQESVRFEELPPPAWRSGIAKARARYLVVPTSLFGKFFPMELIGSDPAYTFTVRWRGGDVAVVEIGPNRSGRVELGEAASPELLARCETLAAKEPGRVDLQTRCAELLAASGRRDDAIERLGAIVARGHADVRIEIALATVLLQEGRQDDAVAAFRLASTLPEAELLRQTIDRGLAGAEAREGATAISRARYAMDNLLWREAETALGEALAAAPDDPMVLATAGEYASRMGDYDRAGSLYRRAGLAGDARAEAKGAALAASLATEASLESVDPRGILAAAAFWAGDGAPGRALDLLERAALHHPSDREIATRLAEVRHFYGLD